MAESGENFRSGGAVGMTTPETGHPTIDGQGGVIRGRGPRLNENSDTPGNTQEPRGKGQGGNEGNGVNGDAIKKKAIELAAQFPQTIGEELATALLTAYPDGTALNLIRRAGVTNKPVIAQLQTEIAEDVAATFATSDQARSLLAEKRRRMRKTVADVAAAKGVLGEDIKDDLVGPEGGYDGGRGASIFQQASDKYRQAKENTVPGEVVSSPATIYTNEINKYFKRRESRLATLLATDPNFLPVMRLYQQGILTNLDYDAATAEIEELKSMGLQREAASPFLQEALRAQKAATERIPIDTWGSTGRRVTTEARDRFRQDVRDYTARKPEIQRLVRGTEVTERRTELSETGGGMSDQERFARTLKRADAAAGLTLEESELLRTGSGPELKTWLDANMAELLDWDPRRVDAAQKKMSRAYFWMSHRNPATETPSPEFVYFVDRINLIELYGKMSALKSTGSVDAVAKIKADTAFAGQDGVERFVRLSHAVGGYIEKLDSRSSQTWVRYFDEEDGQKRAAIRKEMMAQYAIAPLDWWVMEMYMEATNLLDARDATLVKQPKQGERPDPYAVNRRAGKSKLAEYLLNIEPFFAKKIGRARFMASRLQPVGGSLLDYLPENKQEQIGMSMNKQEGRSRVIPSADLTGARLEELTTEGIPENFWTEYWDKVEKGLKTKDALVAFSADPSLKNLAAIEGPLYAHLKPPQKADMIEGLAEVVFVALQDKWRQEHKNGQGFSYQVRLEQYNAVFGLNDALLSENEKMIRNRIKNAMHLNGWYRVGYAIESLVGILLDLLQAITKIGNKK